MTERRLSKVPPTETNRDGEKMRHVISLAEKQRRMTAMIQAFRNEPIPLSPEEYIRISGEGWRNYLSWAAEHPRAGRH